MSVVLKNPKLEKRLAKLGQDNTIRVSKSRLVVSVVEAAVHAAEAQGVTIGQVIEELKSVPVKRRTKRTQRRRSAPPKTLKLTQPSAT